MEWKKYASELKELLNLTGSPVAVTFSMKPPKSAAKGKHRVCNALLLARDGKTIDVTRETSGCNGGTTYLGLGPRPTGKAAEGLKEFLVDGEKLYCSIAAMHRSQELSSNPPLGLAEHVVFAPMDKAEFRPDAVVFIVDPEQACRLVTLDGYDTGIPPKVEMGGATCHQAVGYPVVSGELNVSLMDYTSRRIRGYKPTDLLVTIPYHRLHGVVRSIDRCTAGRAKMEIPESFRRSVSAETIRGLED